jgi:hypothetical protein
LGETKEVASTTERPVSERRLMNSIFVSAGITCFSFCSPSLGPTSTILTNFDNTGAATGAGVVYNLRGERGKGESSGCVSESECRCRYLILIICHPLHSHSASPEKVECEEIGNLR